VHQLGNWCRKNDAHLKKKPGVRCRLSELNFSRILSLGRRMGDWDERSGIEKARKKKLRSKKAEETGK
jgi:hypothetical protein